MLKYSQLLTKIRLKFSDKVDGEIGIEKSLSSKFDQNALEIYRTNLQLFRQAALIFNAKLFVIKQPTLITESISKKAIKTVADMNGMALITKLMLLHLKRFTK